MKSNRYAGGFVLVLLALSLCGCSKTEDYSTDDTKSKTPATATGGSHSPPPDQGGTPPSVMSGPGSVPSSGK